MVNIISSYEHQKKGNSVKTGTGKKGMSFEWLLPRVDMLKEALCEFSVNLFQFKFKYKNFIFFEALLLILLIHRLCLMD